MKTVIDSLLALAMISPTAVFARPGDWGPGPHWYRPGPGWHGPAPRWHGPDHFHVLPLAATAVLIGGLTYYMLNGSYYQRHGDEYVIVEPPAPTYVSSVGGMRVLDFNGRRFYVQDGHYYQREINGSYVEVPRPAGL